MLLNIHADLEQDEERTESLRAVDAVWGMCFPTIVLAGAAAEVSLKTQ